jgi:hypothetical protein
MRLLFLLFLALIAGFIAGIVYSLLFGAAYFLVPANTIHRWRYHNKAYLHFLWFSRQLVATLTSCALLLVFQVKIFGSAVSAPFFFLLCLPAVFVFFSTRFRRPENLHYFDETELSDPRRSIDATNRLEGVTRIIGVVAGLVIARLTFAAGA